MKRIEIQKWLSPCGALIIGSCDGRLCMCDWGRRSVTKRLCRYLDAEMVESPNSLTDTAISQLGEYFAGVRHHFEMPLLTPGTELQQQVWDAICKVEYGTTATYSDIASAVGNPSAVRAVANAVGANALSVIVPCHRIIGIGGRLTGYAGGLDAKRLLLDLESGNYRSLFTADQME